MLTRLILIIGRAVFGPCFRRTHDFGEWKTSDHLHHQKGAREWDCFSGSLRSCRRCGREEFSGKAVAVKCSIIDGDFKKDFFRQNT